MSDETEYAHMLDHLNRKSLILEDTSLFHPVLYFFFVDALAHIDYTLSLLTYSYSSPRVIMNGVYMRWRIDEEKKGDRSLFPGFVNWLKAKHPDRFDRLPVLWAAVYDEDDQAGYRSFRIVIDPDQKRPLPPSFFYGIIEDFFDREFLKSLYNDASLATLFEDYRKESAPAT
jgi:hypothetical protein